MLAVMKKGNGELQNKLIRQNADLKTVREMAQSV